MTLRCLALAAASLATALVGCSSSGGHVGGDGGHGPVDARPDSDGGRAAGDSASTRDAGADVPGVAPGDAARDSRSHPADARSPDAGARDATKRDSNEGPRDSATDAPTATTLSFSLPLFPAFSTSVYDYYVPCTAATNPVVVTMTAAPGSTIALMQPVTSPPAVESTVPVTVDAGAAIVVGITGESGTEQYWVRCLPPGFPAMDWLPHPEAGTPTPGYYLIGTLATPSPSTGGFAIVLDKNGVPVWFQQATAGGVSDVDNLLPDTISFVPAIEVTPTSGPSAFELEDLATATTTDVEAVGAALDYHELRVLPNGDALIFTDPLLTGVDLTGLGSYGEDETVLGCIIEEIDATGAVVWQWDITDHFDAVKDSTFPGEAEVGETIAVDPFHCNSIDVDPSGDLLVSGRSMDSIFLVSKATGAVVWKMGGATYSIDDAPYITVVDDPLTSFHRQHDVRFLPDGTISMFDDQTAEPTPARAVIYSYDLTSATASVVWQFRSTQSSDQMGSFRLLADGSRVISWGQMPTLQAAFSEVTEGGDDLLDFDFADGNLTYRAIKVPTSAFDIGLLRSTAGTGAP